MHKFTTFFLYAVVVDGLLGVLEILDRSHTNHLLSLIAGCVTLACLCMAFVLFVAMMFTPRLSKRLLLPPVLLLGLAVPLSLLTGERWALPITLGEAVLGLGLVVGFKNPGLTCWSLQNFTAQRPLFTVKNFVFTGLFNGVVGLGLLGFLSLGLTQKLCLSIEAATGSYLIIHPKGIELDERTFHRGDREIRLMGMMHIAQSGFYDEVGKSLPADTSAVVLLEGVGDREKRMDGKFDYAGMARIVGISTQASSSFSQKAKESLLEQAEGKKTGHLDYRIADVDLADFRPGTVRFIQALGKIMSSRTANEALLTYSAVQKELKQNQTYVLDDILNKRNQHLLGEIQAALKTHTVVVVPWGAAHMPTIQKQIEQWGFVETKRTPHWAVSFKNKMLIDVLSWAELKD